MKKLIELFISIFKIGAFTFGGGYAMIPLIEEEIVNCNYTTIIFHNINNSYIFYAV